MQVRLARGAGSVFAFYWRREKGWSLSRPPCIEKPGYQVARAKYDGKTIIVSGVPSQDISDPPEGK